MSILVLGVDVGGTNTDVVLIESTSGNRLGSAKTPTTKDIFSGVKNALQLLFESNPHIKPETIFALNLGTTSFLNAFLQNSNELSPVAVFRLCGPASTLIPPFIEFTEELRQVIELKHFFCSGGLEVSGEPITKINQKQLEGFADELVNLAIERKLTKLNIVISGTFSHADDKQEKLAQTIISDRLKLKQIDHSFTLSSFFPNLNIMRRENTAIINECLKTLAERTITSYNYALKLSGLTHVVFHLVQNDGTLISCEDAKKFPIKTFFSGSSNSLKGASKLTQIANAMIADIGGTSTDIARIKDGVAHFQFNHINIAGTPTNLIALNSYSIGLGGGSVIRMENDEITIGPQSVGYKLTESAVAFGGQQLTTTDVAIALDLAKNFPGAKKDLIKVPREVLTKLKDHYVSMLETAIDQMKTEAEETCLVLVGGGSVIIPEDVKIKGVNKLIRPDGFESANAYGAALAGTSTIVEFIHRVGKDENEIAKKFKEIDEKAIKAIENKAIEGSIQLIKEDIQLLYMDGYFRSIRVAIGSLNYSKLNPPTAEEIEIRKNLTQPAITEDKGCFRQEFKKKTALFDSKNLELDKPHNIQIRNGRREWILSKTDILCIALGGAVTGTGGGGSPYIMLKGLEQLLKDRPDLEFRIISPQDMTKEDALTFVGTLGAPLVQQEKLLSKNELTLGLISLEKIFPLLKNSILGCIEIGGSQVLIPLTVGALLNRIVVDGDGMGRAYPKASFFLPFIKGIRALPYVGSDQSGTVFMLTELSEELPLQERCEKIETFLRHNAERIGGRIGCAIGPYTREEIAPGLIKHSYSRVWRIGHAILKSREKKADPMILLKEIEDAREIFRGNIEHRSLRFEGGFNFGRCIVNGHKSKELFGGKKLLIDFQNEFLIATQYDNQQDLESNKNGIVIAQVPHLIVVVDEETFEPIMTSDFKFGMIVRVIVFPSVVEYLEPDVYKVAGPAAFGYKIESKVCPEFKDRGCEIYLDK